jgi:hypothetical protein
MIRAYLVSASIVAMLIDMTMMIGIQFFGLKEASFESDRFRLVAVAIIVSGLGLLRFLAYLAYRRATLKRWVPAIAPCGVARHVQCPAVSAFLIDLHLRFAGQGGMTTRLRGMDDTC